MPPKPSNKVVSNDFGLSNVATIDTSFELSETAPSTTPFKVKPTAVSSSSKISIDSVLWLLLILYTPSPTLPKVNRIFSLASSIESSTELNVMSRPVVFAGIVNVDVDKE